MYRYCIFFLIFLLHGSFSTAQELKTNRSDQLDKPYLILISLDGFRYDYVERFNPPHLNALIREGAQAESLIPCFPSKTFPNHYSIATGMRPMQHRLIGNTFYDAKKQKMYSISKREVVQDGSWYAGTPIWVNAEQQGMVSASYFFVGSEADIKGVKPTYYFPYDGSVPNSRRVDQVLDWLRLPAGNRPHMITAYFSDMDDAGHRYGPNNDEELSKALLQLDEELGRLFDGVRALDIPVNIVVVSDHGMAEVQLDQLLPIEPLESESEYLLASEGALLHIYLKEGVDADAVCQRLQRLEWADHYSVCKATEFPYYLGPKLDPRVGDILVMPDFPYYFTWARTMAFLKSTNRTKMGEHGYTPAYQDMHGILYAWGPAFKAGAKVGSVENIHIYPLICEILDLPIPPEVEGNLEVLKPLLAE
ncbi:MAG: alkaline phosphatase family protein [Saprospirales bacterium]|nr:alkaline phosphatase family protein [Saprospirales bacterium]